MKKILAFLGLGPKELPITTYEVSRHGYKDLYEEDQTLYDISRSYLLDYAQHWDDEAHKQEELKHILSYVKIPFSIPRDRDMKVLKREFKRALNGVDCNVKDEHYKVAVVEIANILTEFKYKSKELRGVK